MRDLQRAMATQEARRKKLLYGFLDGTVAKEMYVSLDREVSSNLERLAVELGELRQAQVPVDLDEAYALLRQGTDLLARATIPEQREFLCRIVERVIIHGSHEFEIVWKAEVAALVQDIV